MDIDIVFLWCDGDDPQIREKREFYLNNSQKEISLEAKAKGRFKNNDELKYALRSVEAKLAWIMPRPRQVREANLSKPSAEAKLAWIMPRPRRVNEVKALKSVLICI